MGASGVRRWVKHYKDGNNTSIQDQSRSGRPRTASTEPNKKRIDELMEDRRVTLEAIVTKFGIGYNAVQETIGSLGYRKICAR
jgi:transposase